MAFLRLLICVGGVYSMFLIWGIAQERLSTPFTAPGLPPSKWGSALIMGALQSLLCVITSGTYIIFRKPNSQSFSEAFGLSQVTHKPAQNGHANTSANGHAKHTSSTTTASRSTILLRSYFNLSLIATFAAPLGFASLSHISYPAMVLGKSCKLIPVLLLNVLLYRRKFASHKYLVVFLVTSGLTVFMAMAPVKNSKHQRSNSTDGGSSLIGLLYLLMNLFLDGLLNSSQDALIARYKITGQQMMFFMNLFAVLINLTLSILPLPYIPALHPSHERTPDILDAWKFLQAYPGAWSALLQFAITGAMGQLFIFETLAHFGSLTLVTITLTRKLFTMLLSVVVYRHRLSMGQYAGAATVFAGISVEAYIKRRDVHLKKVMQEKEKARIKVL